MNNKDLNPGCYTLPLGSDLLWWLAQHLRENSSSESISVILPTQRAADRFKRILYREDPQILNGVQLTSYESLLSPLENPASVWNILWEVCASPNLIMEIFQTLTPSLEQRQHWISMLNSTLSELYAHEITPFTLTSDNPQLQLLFDAYEKAASRRAQTHPTKTLIQNFDLFKEKIPELATSVYLIIDGYVPPKLQEIAVRLCSDHHVLIYGNLIEFESSYSSVSCYIPLYQRLKEACVLPQPLPIYARRQPLIQHLQSSVFKPKNLSKYFENITFIESSDELSLAQEIITIAQSLFKEKKYSITVVTPNRKLAYYIGMTASSAHIAVDDSCGIPLSETSFGYILLNFLQWIENPKNYKQLLNLISHPLLKTYWEDLPSNLDAWGRCQTISFYEALSTYVPENSKERQKLSDLLRLVNMPRPADFTARLDSAVSQLKAWDLCMDTFPEYNEITSHIKDVKDFELLKFILNTITFRPPTPSGQRIRILGPLEVRLIQPEIIILANMNEGDWLPPSSFNPWLHSKLREDLGLPPSHQLSTLISKIFLSSLGCKHVYLCRTTHTNGQITQPSRWWERLRVLSNLSQATLSHLKPSSPHYEDRITRLPLKIPATLVPKRISISDLSLWINDPKTFVLKSILKLNKIPEWEKTPDHLDKGIIIHEILDTTVRQNLSFNDMKRLMSHKLALLNLPSHERMFWEYHITQCLQHFQALHKSSRPSRIWTETKGEWTINTGFGEITLVGKADRIDQMEDGSIHVIDYKTGTPPTKNAIHKGLAPQLSILGLMVMHGAFSEIPPASPFMVSYWNLKEGSASNFLFEELRPLEQTFRTAIERLLDPNAV